ncbi:hypothetical protein Goshw_028664 [Gossypium schwendimanii]|uniref:Reverse transcriptase zinc-binding domain-containing protein n=1 Tax=Gossypium schwendimanii TaxID=34291 RepID=A0A7J9MQ43_GOSSC|nr:hypothetical protein [Gossypium schwendimanii]
MERVHRKIGHDLACGVCGHGFEDVLHAIRDCSLARSIWDQYLGNCFVLDAELWGILDGLDILIGRVYDNVLIQPDNLEATKVIQEISFEGSNSTLIRRIHQLLLQFGQWGICASLEKIIRLLIVWSN